MNLLEVNSWLILLKTLEKINQELYNEIGVFFKKRKKYDVEKILNNILKKIKTFSYETSLKEVKEIINEKEEYEKEKTEFHEKLIALFNSLESLFIDSNFYDNDSLSNIVESLRKLIKESSENKKSDSILFYTQKILTISVLNIDKIEIIYKPIITILTFVYEQNFQDISQYCFDIICSIIIQVLLQYKLKSETDSNFNKNWSKTNWQRTTLYPILSICNSQNFQKENIENILENLEKIIQLCGQRLDTFEWGTIIEILSILINFNVEKNFILDKKMLNDYKEYFSPFNIIPLLSLIGTFSLFENDKNICFSAIELFWNVSIIIDIFQNNKIKLTDVQKEIFDELQKNSNQTTEMFYQEIWKQIFFKLSNINSDYRSEIRKS